MEADAEGVRPAAAPRVACVIPVHNGARYLRQAIESVLDQTYAPLDLVVVDDGSSDESATIAASYGDRVRCLAQTRGGPAAARNAGVRATPADYVAFLDQDDWWPADKIAVQMAHFARRVDLDVSVGHVESVFVEETSARTTDVPRRGIVPGYIPGTMLVRRTAFERVGGFAEPLWFVDALDWFARAREQQVVVELLPDVLLFHRVHDDNLSRRGDDSRREALRVLRGALTRRRQRQDSGE
jgi:glycosyltransferase involved in cell wall biosynthesis